MAWADAGMGAPIGGGLAEDAEERQRIAAVKQAFDERATGLVSEWRSADDSGPTAIGTIGRAYDLIVLLRPAPCRRCRRACSKPRCSIGSSCARRAAGLQRHGRQAHPVRVERFDGKRARDLVGHARAERAETIEVLSVEGAMVPGPSAMEIAESLKSHGLNVTGQHVKPGAKTAGQTIVDRAQALVPTSS